MKVGDRDLMGLSDGEVFFSQAEALTRSREGGVSWVVLGATASACGCATTLQLPRGSGALCCGWFQVQRPPPTVTDNGVIERAND